MTKQLLGEHRSSQGCNRGDTRARAPPPHGSLPNCNFLMKYTLNIHFRDINCNFLMLLAPWYLKIKQLLYSILKNHCRNFSDTVFKELNGTTVPCKLIFESYSFPYLCCKNPLVTFIEKLLLKILG